MWSRALCMCTCATGSVPGVLPGRSRGVDVSVYQNTVDWKADADWDWHSAAHDTPEQLNMIWQDAVARSRTLVTRALAAGGLDRPATGIPSSWGPESPSLRWIVVHMIEEHARHNGHADLLRESVDGETGE